MILLRVTRSLRRAEGVTRERVGGREVMKPTVYSHGNEVEAEVRMMETG